ncbi:thioredoxin trx1 [Saitoella coloradoensis]|uniref:thioredoxine 2 n=1 Tax=Saitoella complicata (strain BCRC 22490 / CBS 7301 / JCM 7358 / NBRC 10748 / NRRL Y-17804) TaxID=698492 RepID=UPI00086772B5|nr:thioredoxine 2 [Saitoella complicata NRRL Y-17804]ODQ52116.1 thioredoxine 2 [Saitoella complicata NRRL Y-17804]
MVHLISAAEEFDSTIAGPQLTVVDFYATWCGPCKAIAPKVTQFSNTYADAKFVKIDVDELSEVAAKYNIRAMPTFLLFKNGEKVGEVVGASAPNLEKAIKENL